MNLKEDFINKIERLNMKVGWYKDTSIVRRFKDHLISSIIHSQMSKEDKEECMQALQR